MADFPRSLVIDHLRDSFADQNAAIAYIYCNYKEHDDQSADQMLSSLLKQLAISQGKICRPAEELYQRFKSRDRRPQMQDLVQTLLHLCDATGRVFIVIDALDECSSKHKIALLNFLTRIHSKPSASIMITSRSFPENVSKPFISTCKISIGAHKADLKRYILQEIENSDNADIIDETFEQEIVDRISLGAHNMYVETPYICFMFLRAAALTP